MTKNTAPKPENTAPIPADIAALKFEDAMAELEKIVRTLESGAVALDQSIALYERGGHLRAHCAALLQAAQVTIDKITLSADGRMGTTPLDD